MAVGTAATVGVGGADCDFEREDDHNGKWSGEVNRLGEREARMGEEGVDGGTEDAVK